MAQAPDLSRRIQAIVAEPGVSRAHWGVAVTKLDGTPIYGLNEAQLFQPASNAKLFTTSTAMALLGPETTYTTKVDGRGVWTGSTSLKGDIVLIGSGDANLSGRTIPYLSPKDRPKKPAADMPADPLRHLAAMADQVASTGLKLVDGDIIGDDTLFPWEPYPADWSIDDAVWGYGAPVSALTINDNQIGITVAPGVNAGDAASIVVDPTLPAYYRIDASGLTTGPAKSGSHVQMERMIGSRTLRLYGRGRSRHRRPRRVCRDRSQGHAGSTRHPRHRQGPRPAPPTRRPARIPGRGRTKGRGAEDQVRQHALHGMQ
jgi:D-alanyl-D-alanine carboxypeptidase/D-alanyl-D-alanine-endopeptidase (penicillin-binding protein 4)